MRAAMMQLNLSAHAYHRILKLVRKEHRLDLVVKVIWGNLLTSEISIHIM